MPRSDAELEAFRNRVHHLTLAFQELLAGLSFEIPQEERGMVEHYIEHREFGLAFDRLCDSVLPGMVLTPSDRAAIRRVGANFPPTEDFVPEARPWLGAKQNGEAEQ